MKSFLISFIICFGLRLLVGQPLNFLALTHYKPNSNDYCGNTNTYYDYFYMALCANAVPPTATQLQVTIEVPLNPDFNPTPTAIICVQLSTCKDDFSEGCFFATNCVYNATDGRTYGFADLVININKFCADISNCTVFSRLMARPQTTKYSVQFTFVGSKPEKFLGFTNTYFPWDGPKIDSNIGEAKVLSQYWASDETYKALVNEFTYFYIAYCPQTTVNVDEIEIVVTSPVDNTVTLLQVFACPMKNVANYTICTADSAENFNWCYAPYIAPFFVLPCKASQNTPLYDGLYVVVNTLGNATNEPNEFIFQAIIGPSS